MTTKNEGGNKTPLSADEDTKQILEEMAEDGFEVPADADLEDTEEAPQKKKEAKKDDDKDEDEDDAEEKDEDEEDDLDEDEDDEETEDEEADEEENDEDDEEDEDGDSKKITADDKKTIPMWQHKKELNQQASRLRRELGEVATAAQKTGETFDEDSEEVKAIIKDFGLDEEKGGKFIATILNTAVKGVEKTGKFKEVDRLKQHVLENSEERAFQADLQKAMPLVRKILPDASAKQIKKVSAKIRELAYSDEYQHYSLKDIIKLNRKTLIGKDPIEKRRVGEHSTRAKVNRGTKSVDLDHPESIDFSEDALTDSEFEKISNALGERSSRLKIQRRRR